jgi:hypothetical protein
MPSKNKKPYPDGIWPRNQCTENITTAIPYAGITQVRFKGYLLSLNPAPLVFVIFTYSKPPPKSSRFFRPKPKSRRAFSSVNRSSSPAAMPRISARQRAVSTT